MKKVSKFVKNMFGLAVLAAAMVAVPACSSDDDEPVSNAITEIKADVVNGDNYNSVVDKVRALAEISSVWNEQLSTYIWAGYPIAESAYVGGGFTLQLPATLPDAHITLLSEILNDDKLTISPATVKAEVIDIFVAYGKTGQQVGRFRHLKGAGDAVEAKAMYIYADNNVTVKGSDTGVEDDLTYSYEWNVSLTKGWNVIYVTNTANETAKTLTIVYSNKNPGGLQWIFIEDTQSF
jgi:hypothetical protein